MKKIVHIAAVLSLVFFASCQKDDFQDAYEQADVAKENKTVVIIQNDDDKSSTEVKDEYSPDYTADELTKNPDRKGDIIISIKEVSDGDDEADDGDDSELN